MLLIGLFTLLMAIALYSDKITSTLFNRITIILLIYSGILSFNTIYPGMINQEIGIYGNLFHVTTLSQSFDLFILVLGAIILLLNEYPFKIFSLLKKTNFNDNSNRLIIETDISNKRSNYILNNLISLPTLPEYSLVVIFTLLGGVFLLSSNDLVSMYLSIELQSFAVYILASIYRESESATSAGLKYFLLGGLSSGFILLGSSLLYGFSGLTNFDNIYTFSFVNYNVFSSFTDLNDLIFNYYNSGISIGIVQLGILIISIGFLFKIAAAPFHNWAPDVYDGVPTIVTTWLTVIPKISILIFLLSLKIKIGFESEEMDTLFKETFSLSNNNYISYFNYKFNIQL